MRQTARVQKKSESKKLPTIHAFQRESRACRVVCINSVYLQDLLSVCKINCNERTQPWDTLSTVEICLLLPNYQQLPVTALTYICFGHT